MKLLALVLVLSTALPALAEDSAPSGTPQQVKDLLKPIVKKPVVTR